MSRKAKRYTNDDKVVNFNNYANNNKKVVLLPRSLNQEDYIEKLLNEDLPIVFASGPAGTGKTMLAVMAAIRALKEQSIQRIVVTRPAVGVDDERHGFLPGDINSKMEPWTRPIFDVFHEYYSVKDTAKMLEDLVIEISPLAFMRGRTFKNSFIIADEMQSSTPNQMQMLLTRIGEGSRMVITGDLNQTDKDYNNGLRDFLARVKSYDGKFIDLVKFDNGDIQRHPVISEILDIYGDK